MQRREACRAAFALGLGLMCAALASVADAQTAADLSKLSLEELANVPVTTVSKREESLAKAPAAIYVITQDQIRRSGAQTLPEILRLAPNLFVARTSASSWQISARGASGNIALQNFSNKLLILVDGRSVYTPLFSGVYWDLQDVLPQDIERIEVISGPAGTLWGANAVNGVVNIITKTADQTQGGLVAAGGGDQEQSLGARFGGKLGANAAWRVYAHAYHADDTVTPGGSGAPDRWTFLQGGFRLDWAPTERDSVSLHGDVLSGSSPASGNTNGANIVADWTHVSENGSTLQVRGYFDRERRGQDRTGGLPLWTNAFDFDVQDEFTLGRNDIVVGGGVRATQYHLYDLPNFQFAPDRGTLDLGDVFAQDTLSLTSRLRLIAGLKMEYDPYAGWSALPNARIAWTPTDTSLFWAAVSRTIRSPTPFDESVREDVGGKLFLEGNPAFRPEKLTAYEIGTRLEPLKRVSVSVSAYYNDYGDLRSIEATPKAFFPLYWGNEIGGHTYGVEAWSSLQATEWWRLSASVNLLSEHLAFAPGSAKIGGTTEAGDDPHQQAKLSSSVDLGHGVSWDAEVRYQGLLPAPRVPAYTELNTRIAWAITKKLEISVSGFNLLHKNHQELMAPQANAVPRSIYGGLAWRF